jgi:TetR/AcrR family transcriptional regulator
VNSAMIYYYFRNKQGLYQAIIEKLLSELSEILESAIQEERDPVANLKRYVYEYTNFLRRRNKTAQLVFQAIFFKDTDMDLLVERYWAKHFIMIERILSKGVKTGVFRPIDTRLVTISIRGMILWYFMSSPITSRFPGMADYQNKYDEKLAEKTLDILLQGMLSVRETS